MGVGYEWISTLEEALRAEGFFVERGYPAKNAIYVIGTVVAVNLTQLDVAQQSVGATATVLVPRKYGLDHCQEMAEKAANVLSTVGGQWHFSGWKFDKDISCFLVEVKGTISFLQGGGIQQTGYEVLLGEESQSYVTDFLARQQMDRRLIRPHGQREPVGVTPGMGGWSIQLTQMIPTGQAEPGAATEPFVLTVKRGGQTVAYNGCYWTDYSSRQLEQGTEVIRSGFALSREVSADGQDGV